MENEEKGILVEQVVQADRIRTHGKFHERLFLLLRVIYFLIGMLGVVLGLALTYEIELNYVLLVVGTIVIGNKDKHLTIITCILQVNSALQ